MRKAFNLFFPSRIPETLIYLRLILGPVMILLSAIDIPYYTSIAIILLIIGLLTDIFDGIIARRLNISTQKLRRLDSTIDQVFFSSVAIATWIQCPGFFKTHATELIILLSLEALAYLICYLRFRKEVATHTIGAKLWTLLLCATLIEVIWQCQSTTVFVVFFWVGVLTRLEIIAIILIIKKWTNDIPSFYHAIQLRKNKKIKRNKLFNG